MLKNVVIVRLSAASLSLLPQDREIDQSDHDMADRR